MADTQDEVATKSVEVSKPTKRLQHSLFRKFVCNKCCFCIPLRTGCLILAYLYLVSSFVIGIFYIWVTISVANGLSQFPEGDLHTFFATLLVINSVHLGLVLFAIPFIVLLLIGLHKEKRSFVRVFVRFQLACIALNALHDIVVAAIGYLSVVGIGIGLASLVLNIYYALVMRSQYLKMGATASSEPVGLYKDVLNIYFTLVMRSQYLKMGAAVGSAPAGQLYSDGD